MTSLIVIGVLAEHETNIAGRQIHIQGKKEALSCQNPDHPVELPKKKARKSEEGKDHVTPRRDNQGPRCLDRSTTQKIRELDVGINAMNTDVRAPVTVEALIRQIEPPLTDRILRTQVSSRFKLPTQLGVYEGMTDPMDHIDSYKSLMSLQRYSDEVTCKAFFATLKESAMPWFRKLPPGTIDSFGGLSRLFVANFMSYQVR